MLEKLFSHEIKAMIEHLIEEDAEYIADALCAIAKKKPHSMADVLFSVLQKLTEEELQRHQPELQKLLKVGMGKDWNNFQTYMKKNKAT